MYLSIDPSPIGMGRASLTSAASESCLILFRGEFLASNNSYISRPVNGVSRIVFG